MDSVTLHGVIYTASDEYSTDHSAWATEDAAARAGADLARRVWADEVEPDEKTDDGLRSAWDQAQTEPFTVIDMARTYAQIRLEVEPVEVGRDVLRSAVVMAGKDEADEFFIDTIADLLKAAHAEGYDMEQIVRSASMHAKAKVGQRAEPGDTSVAEMQALVTLVEDAAEGDSNDGEIEALQFALEASLGRWPEVNYHM